MPMEQVVRSHSRRRLLMGFLPGLLLMTCLVSVGAQEKPSRTELLAQLQRAVNKSDLTALQAFAAPGETVAFDWAKDGGTAFNRRRPYQAKVLELPGLVQMPDKAAGTFVVFTRYNAAQTTGDHLYPVALTPQGLRLRPEIPETETNGYRVRDHKFKARFEIAAHRVTLTDRFIVERQASVPALPAVVLRINAIYKVTGVKKNGQPVPFTQAGGFLALAAPTGEEAKEGARVTYDMAYRATVTGSNEDFILPREAALTSYWYPHTSRLPTPHEVTITVPKGWTAIGQGTPTGKTVAGNEVTFGFKNPLPVCFMTIAAGKYTVTSRKFGDLTVSAYLLNKNPRRADNAITTAAGALQWFGKNFAPFPFKQYTVVESLTFPPALECYSFTLCGVDMIPLAVVHEVSHTWWGGIVPNAYTRTLWNESFAEYSDMLYGRRTGHPALEQFSTRMAATMDVFSGSTMMTAKDAMNDREAAVGYGKGSLVLENLERMLGTPKMLACMQRFAADHKAKKFGEAAEWQDFIDAVSEVAGKEWADFFPAWLTRTDLPNLRLQNTKVEKDGAKYVVSGEIVQDDPAFWLQLPLVVETEETPVRKSVAVKGVRTPFRIETGVKPMQIALDPNIETLRANPNSRTLNPDLAAVMTSNGSLLVVYATGGTPEETAAVRQAANTQVNVAYPFATLKIQADTETTEEQLAKGNVLLLGRPDSLKIPDAYRVALPIRYEKEAILLGGKRYTGANVWGLSVTAHPLRPKALLVHAAGVSAAALKNFAQQGNLDDSASRFVVRGAGVVLKTERTETLDATVVSLKL